MFGRSDNNAESTRVHGYLDNISHGEMRGGIEIGREVLGSDNTETDVSECTREPSSDGEISTSEDSNHLLHFERLITELEEIHKTRLVNLPMILVGGDDNSNFVRTERHPFPRSHHVFLNLSHMLSNCIVRDVRSSTGGFDQSAHS
ncbi:hypothetical protein PMAYCL1PPCAC_24292, partial [Pristionchus mayeri]